MEHECLNILLKGSQPIIICPARNIEGMRIKAEYIEPLDEGRLLFLSPFLKRENRISSEKALMRNLFVAAIAQTIFIPHAAPQSNTDRFWRQIVRWEKPVHTFDTRVNAHLMDIGITRLDVDCLRLDPV